jgi:hypothetical protein
MTDYRKIFICLVFFSIPFLIEFSSNAETDSRFHEDFEITYFEMLQDSLLPKGFNDLFAASGECIQCHGFDTAGIASVNMIGEDINVVDDWRASMMANSAKDPFWRAKVSHEVLLYPQHKNAIETKCTSCHAPLGHFNAIHNGANFYTIDSLVNDTIALDGVSCLACHKQTTENLGNLNSGNLNFDTAKVAYGPYISPLESPMIMETGYKPVFSEHISDAGICAGCHTLITETLDYDGNLTGDHFVEQATYHEWLNSEYNTNNTTCQNCHMPAYSKGEVFLVSGFETEPRSPFYLHDFAGANAFMLNILKNNSEALDVAATPEQFDEAIAATNAMLLNQSINVSLDLIDRTVDTAFFDVSILNIAGHKFPSGYPSRRVFVEFLVETEDGDTLFISGKTDENFEVEGQNGKTDENFEVEGQNSDYEPHYNVITSEEQVQIYEMVMADVNDDVTTVLERAKYVLKDNRLPPKGFVTEHSVYDTVQIVGLATQDENFNKDEGVEGNGSDHVFYNIPLNGHYEKLQATCKIYYQTAPLKWMKEMFDEATEEIDIFREMFQAADRNPILLKTRSIEVDEIIVDVDQPRDAVENTFLVNNFSNEGIYKIKSKQIHDIAVYNLKGQRVLQKVDQYGDYQIKIYGPKGLYIITFYTKTAETFTKKIVYH